MAAGLAMIGGVAAAATLAGPRIAGLLASTALVAAPSSLLALAVGAPLGWVLGKTDAAGRRLALSLLVAGWLLPLHVVAAGWLAAIGPGGWALAPFAEAASSSVGLFQGYSGAIVIHAVAAVPWAAILSLVAFRRVDRRREEQALLDASALRVSIEVTWRDAAPSLAAIAVLLAVFVSAEIAVTDLLRVRTFAEEVYVQAAAGQLLADRAGEGVLRLAAGVATLVTLGGAALAALIGRLAPAGSFERTEPWRLRLGSQRGAVAFLLFTVISALIAVPVASLVHQAGLLTEPTPDGARRSWSASKALAMVAAAPWQQRRELGVSLSLATVVATTSALLAAVAAWRLRSSRRPYVTCVLLAIALATPGPLWGFATIRLLNQPLDSWAWPLGELYGTWFAPWLAQSVRLAPMAMLIAWPAMKRVPDDLIEAARADGARWPTRLARVATPIAAPAIVAAWLVVFALSVGELSATALVVPPGTPPLSVRLLTLLHYGVEDRVAAICLVLVASCWAIGGGVVWLLRRSF